MKVHLTRDSVAMGDDADAPQSATRDLPAEVSAGEAVISVVRSGYLASIAGGEASWVLTWAGVSIAVIAQHFRYLAQRDPGAIFEELRAASAT